MADHDEECTCGGMPEGAVILNELVVVEYMDPKTGIIWKEDFSRDSFGADLDHGKALELAEWSRMLRQAPILAEIVHSFLHAEDNEE